MDDILRVDDVFGTARDLPKNYVIRKHVDDAFISALSKGTHVVVYGGSKQGKTSLRKKHLMSNDHIVVTCSRGWNISNIHEAILKAAGYQISASESLTTSGKTKICLTIGPGDTEISNDTVRQINKKHLELDIESVNDIIRALEEIDFKKFIIIEEFHYLSEETQIDFAHVLKAYHELSKHCFIIIGVWLEDDRLTAYNNDLVGRVISVNADTWTEEDIDNLLQTSEQLLNIEFTNEFKLGIKKHCKDNVFLVQQICMKACEAQNLYHTQSEKTVVAKTLNIYEEIKSTLSMQSGRYTKFLMAFGVGFQPTELELYKWIIAPLIEIDEEHLRNGITAQAIRRYIEPKHPNGNQVSILKLVGALNKCVALQQDKNIRPIVIEYDTNRQRLKIVDKGFLLWRSFQDRNELFELADLDAELHTTSRNTSQANPQTWPLADE
ncbi:hypothetical protein L0Y47_07185 [Ectopseudomonas composti]